MLVGVLMVLRDLRRHARHHLGADHQGRDAAVGTSFMAFMVLKHFGFSTEAMFASAVAVHAKGQAIMAPAACCPTRWMRFPWGWA
jgi:hypothetical protein